MSEFNIKPKELRGVTFEKRPNAIPYYVSFRGVDNQERHGEVIITEGRLKKLASKLMKVQEFAYDTETNTLRVQAKGEMQLVGISISWGEFNNYYIPVYHAFDKYTLPLETVVKHLKPCFQREDVRIIGQNLKYDLHVLANVDMEIKTKDIFDTMVARWITDENEAKGLKEMTSSIYDIPQTHFDECLTTVTKPEREYLGLSTTAKYIPFYATKIKNGASYAIADAYWTWRHYVDWEQDLLEKEKMETIFRKGSMPFLLTLYGMERRGIRVDKERLIQMKQQAEKDLEELEYEIYEIAEMPFQISSPQQLAEILFGYKKFNKKGEFSGNAQLVENSFNYAVINSTPTGVPKTGDAELKALCKKTFKKDKRKQEGLKMVKLIRDYKKLSKLYTAFIVGLIEQTYDDGKIHPTYNQCGTDSGRLSCSNPNLQQLPRPVELDDPEDFKEWHNKTYGEEATEELLDNWEEAQEHLVLDRYYPTGELEEGFKVPNIEIKEYLEYLTDWRDRNESSIFWKFYEIRACFTSDDTESQSLIALDFSNLEMRLLAHFSEDKYLMETFIEEHDAHGATAVNMFALDCEPDQAKKKYKPLRQIAKTLNFLLMYGGSAITLFNTLDAEDAVDEDGNPITKEKAQVYYDKYFEAYSGVAEFIKNQKRFAHKHGCVYTVLGRKRRLHNINSSDFRTVAYEERLSVNSAIQGSGGDIMMMCQPKIENDPRLKEIGCNMRLQVHDEVVLNCPDEHLEEAIKIVKNYMEHSLPRELNIPLRADYDTGKTYADAK